MDKIIIRKAQILDIDGIIEVEKLSFKIPWSKQSFIDEIQTNNLSEYLVAVIENNIVGYGGVWWVFEEGQITNIAVHQEYRKIGVGKKILGELIKIAKEKLIKSLTLEVRPSNIPAIKLYESFGFKLIGKRKNYYADTKEDALLLECIINSL